MPVGRTSPESGSICPYLIAEGEQARARASTHSRCGTGSTPRAVSVHRQTASCLSPSHVRCADYASDAPEGAPAPPRPVFSFAAFDATAAEAGLLLLMIGMIAFALFAIAPRPSPSFPGVAAEAASDPDRAVKPAPAKTPGVEPTASTPAPTAHAVVVMAASAPSPTPSKPKSYLVRPGDTLFSIARANGVTVDALARANGLSDPKALRAGQTLQIP